MGMNKEMTDFLCTLGLIGMLFKMKQSFYDQLHAVIAEVLDDIEESALKKKLSDQLKEFSTFSFKKIRELSVPKDKKFRFTPDNLLDLFSRLDEISIARNESGPYFTLPKEDKS